MPRRRDDGRGQWRRTRATYNPLNRWPLVELRFFSCTGRARRSSPLRPRWLGLRLWLDSTRYLGQTVAKDRLSAEWERNCRECRQPMADPLQMRPITHGQDKSTLPVERRAPAG